MKKAVRIAMIASAVSFISVSCEKENLDENLAVGLEKIDESETQSIRKQEIREEDLL